MRMGDTLHKPKMHVRAETARPEPRAAHGTRIYDVYATVSCSNGKARSVNSYQSRLDQTYRRCIDPGTRDDELHDIDN